MCNILQSINNELINIENECIEENKDINLDVYGAAEAQLLNLPVEIILKICSFLDPSFLKHTLSKVCSRFRDILADDHLWKYWIHSKIHGCFPILPNLKYWENFDVYWEDVCVEMDEEKKKWCNVKDTMSHIVAKDVHFASVDTVLLVNQGDMCVSGGRDRSMTLWKLSEMGVEAGGGPPRPTHVKADAHAGWVWDLACDRVESTRIVYSASWDNTVKAWDLGTELRCLQTFRCGMSALSLATHENIVMAGLFSKNVLMFDMRAGPNHIRTYQPHRGSVLALSKQKNLVASVSDDNTISVYDAVANKLLASKVKVQTEKAFPASISWSPTSLYIGDSRGSLHLMHPEQFTYLKSQEIWPEPPETEPPNKITSCCQSQGSLILCSDRGEIKFLYNCFPPQEYASLKTSTKDITQSRYVNGVFVISTCESALEFWLPKDRFSLQ